MLESYFVNWLDILVVAIIGFNAIVAYNRGFIITVFRFTNLILAIILTRIIYPTVSEFIMMYTKFYEFLIGNIKEALNLENLNISLNINEEIQKINELELPHFIEQALLENNNYEAYNILGVEGFGDYIAGYLATISINIISMIVVFIAVSILLRLIINVFDLIAKLPLLNSINKLAGLAVGLAFGLIIVWIGDIVITLFYTSASFEGLVSTLEDSGIALWLYQNNLLANTFLQLINVGNAYIASLTSNMLRVW
ncbi:CvpA family protein [Vallitalea okinawensis]|uniref:CvpA family protein n=1 Tax=Vallitalea okinawensis TaxID=2078660 RepID=UPI000CFB62E7|nr:CvpA family protein [Vallitalea okinawensis]